jgi:hypothetical protein
MLDDAESVGMFLAEMGLNAAEAGNGYAVH